jgi:hypothetical protein
VGTGSRMNMLIHKVKEIPITKRTFILERWFYLEINKSLNIFYPFLRK